MSRRTLVPPNARMRIVGDDGLASPEFIRFLKDWHAVLVTNQSATDATVMASAPLAIEETTGVNIIYRPTTSAGSGYEQPAAAYDNNPSTPATATISGVQTEQRTWSGFSALNGSASAMALKITSAIAGVVAPAVRDTDIVKKSFVRGTMVQDDPVTYEPSVGATATLAYSFDGGKSWNQLHSSSDVDSFSDSVDIPMATKLSDVQVRATARGLVAGAAITHKILEIWIEVTP